MVENWGFAPSESALYKLGRLSPVSAAIFVMPMALAICPSAVMTSELSPSSKMVFRYSAVNKITLK